MEELKEYLICAYGPDLEAIGLSKKASEITIDAIIKNAESDIESQTAKSMLSTIGTAGGAGALIGLLKSYMSRAKGESIGSTISDALKNTLAYGALGAGAGGIFSTIMPRTSTILGSNIHNTLFKDKKGDK